MDLRLPVIAAIAGAAALAAGVRAFHHDSAPDPFADGVAVSLASASPHVVRVRPVAQRVTVYVAGEVAHAGVYALPASDRAIDALKVAGGASPLADLVGVNLAQPITDGEEIVVPAKGAESTGGAATARTRSRTGHARKRHRKRRVHAKRHGVATSADAATTDPPTDVVDLNTADENELETLPGIGPSLAERIVAFRELNGPYASADDLLDVGGMTQGRLDAISDYVTTGPR